MSISQSDVVMDMSFYLYLKGESERIEITDGLVCGRHHKSDVVIKDPKVSGKHISFHFKDGEFFVEDLGSANKTYVNNKKISVGELHPLSNGDVIRIGRTLLGVSHCDSVDYTSIIRGEFMTQDVSLSVSKTSSKEITNDTPHAVGKESTLSALISPSELNLDTSRKYIKGGKEEKRDGLIKQIKEAKNKIKDLEEEREKVKAKVSGLGELRHQYGELKEKRDQVREYFKSRPIQEREALKSERDKQEKEIQEIQSVIEEKKKEMAEIQRIIDEKSKELKSKSGEKEKLEEDLSEADRFDSLSEQMGQLKERIEEVKELQKGRKAGELQKNIESEQGRLKELQKDYSNTF